MKYAYPQDPTHSVSAIRRYDEAADLGSRQSAMERQQSSAVIGETVPVVFGHRFDWGGNLGVNGGVWVSPRLIQLGVQSNKLSMMYLLTQGKVTGLKTDYTYWGRDKLKVQDSSGVMCYGYEVIPSCINLDYVPGGSISWTSPKISKGPRLGSLDGGEFVSDDDVIKLVFTFNATIEVNNTYKWIDGFDEYIVLRDYGWYNKFVQTEEVQWWKKPDREPFTVTRRQKGDREALESDDLDFGLITQGRLEGQARSRSELYYDDGRAYQQLWNFTGKSPWHPGDDPAKKCYGEFLRPEGFEYWYSTYKAYDYEKFHRTTSYKQTSEMRYNYQVFDDEYNSLVKEDQIWIQHGSTELVIDNLPKGRYRVVFSNGYAERDQVPFHHSISTPTTYVEMYKIWKDACAAADGDFGRPPSSGFRRQTNSGSLVQTIDTTVTQTILTELNFPVLPGGSVNYSGTFDDLTMVGINGDVNALRPLDGPDYFLQAHLFVEDGIHVDRLTLGGNGPSPFYGDLVNYLMRKSQVLKPDQIDTASLIVANQVASRYDLYFNGQLNTTNSLAEWMTRTAPYFLMTPRQVDGKYGLWPVCPLNAANELSRDKTVPVLTITRDDIIAGSYSRTYISPKDRRAVCLTMVYRDQPTNSVGQNVTIEVRYPNTALTGPWESHDLTELCCRAEQAVYAARYILAKRRHTTHTVAFAIGRRGAQLKPGDIVKVDLTLTTTDGAGISDAVFYQIESLSEGQAGAVEIEATHFPTANYDGVDDVSVVAYETHQGAVVVQ